MQSTKKKWSLGLVVLAALVLALSGCGTPAKQTARGLYDHEADKLLAAQAARAQKVKEDDSPLDPAQLEAHGDAMAMKGEWVAALFQYNRVLGLIQPAERGRIRGKMAVIHLRNAQWAQAEAQFKLLIESRDDNAEAWQGLGVARLARGDLAGAIKALVRAVELEPNRWKAHDALGIACNRQGRPEEALKHLDLALSLNPRSPAVHNNRGMAFLLQGDLRRAEECFRRALELEPSYSLASNNLGLLYARQGRFNDALKAFEQAIGRAEAHNNVGCFLAWQGRFRDAAEHFRQALVNRPQFYDLADRHLNQISDRLR